MVRAGASCLVRSCSEISVAEGSLTESCLTYLLPTSGRRNPPEIQADSQASDTGRRRARSRRATQNQNQNNRRPNGWWRTMRDIDHAGIRREREPVANSNMQRALAYIHQHYSESIKLESAAAEANMSASHFCRMFKEVRGVGVCGLPQQAACQTRMRNARNDAPTGIHHRVRVRVREPLQFQSELQEALRARRRPSSVPRRVDPVPPAGRLR